MGLTAVVFATALTVGAWGASAATLPADIEVADTSCADGQIYAVELSVAYHGDASVEATAHVWSSRSHVQFAWAPTRVNLTPGAQTVRLRAPRQRAAVAGDRAQVALNAGQQRAIVNWETTGCV